MKYSITNLNDKNYNLIGIKLSNGKTCCYWSNKDSNSINSIVVIFDNSNVVNVENNKVCISLNGISDKKDVMDMIEAFGRELYKDGFNITKIHFDFIVDNKEEEDIVDFVMDKYMLNGDIVKSDKYSYLTENLDDAISNISYLSERRQISKNHDTLKEIDLENGNTSLIDKKKRELLSRWMNDPAMLLKISSLTREQLDKKLSLALGESLEVDEDVDVKEDIVDDNSSLDNIVTDLEEDETVDVNFIENTSSKDIDEIVDTSPMIDDFDKFISTNPIKNDLDNGNDDFSKDRLNDSASVNDYFWGEDEFNNSFEVPVRNNLSDRRDNSISNEKVKILKKPDRPVYSFDNRKKGSISFPLIIFIISFLLLVGSVVILYLMK